MLHEYPHVISNLEEMDELSPMERIMEEADSNPKIKENIKDWKKNFPHMFEEGYEERANNAREIRKECRAYQKEFLDKHQKLSKTIKKKFGRDPKLVYRVDPIVSDVLPLEKDTLDQTNKFGGYPDLRYLWHMAFKGPSERRCRAKNKKPIMSVVEWLGAVWPRCGCCFGYMDFIGQLDLRSVNYAIHRLTREKTPYGDTESFLGYGKDTAEAHSFEANYQFFYCPCWTLYDTGSDATILSVDDPGLTKLFLNDIPKKQYLSEKRYMTGVKKFMEKNGISPGHPCKGEDDSFGSGHLLRFVDGFEINFEVQENRGSEDWDYQDFAWDLMGKAPYSLYGNPRSQQQALKPFDLRGNRMAPVLSWHDDDVSSHGSDVTCQMYATLLQWGREDGPIRGKMDNSCT